MTDYVEPSEMEELEELLDELCDLTHRLDSFEMDFIQNLSEWDGCFTEPQADTLRTMYERHCG